MQPYNLIIPAAGSAQRMGSDLPKQYCHLGDSPMLLQTLKAFEGEAIALCVVAVSDAYRLHVEEMVEGLSFPVRVVLGGETRAESVKAALDLCSSEIAFTLIHDAARPFVSSGLIKSVLKGLEEHSAVIPGVAVTDTVKEISGNKVSRTIDRKRLTLVQTPQGFHTKILKALYEENQYRDFTDEAGLMESAGEFPYVVLGESDNIKITQPTDWRLAHFLLDQRNS